MKFARSTAPTVAAALMACGWVSAAGAQEAKALDAVVITASGFEQAVEDAPASITVIPRAELEKRAYRDVTDALRDVPGVLVTGGGFSAGFSTSKESARKRSAMALKAG